MRRLTQKTMLKGILGSEIYSRSQSYRLQELGIRFSALSSINGIWYKDSIRKEKEFIVTCNRLMNSGI